MIKGIVASVLASVLFSGIYFLSPFLAPLDGEQIFGWRVLLTLPFTTALLLWRGEGTRLRQLWHSVRQAPRSALGLLLSAAMLGVQLWLFMWAPLHGRALPVSLGYFLLPLVMVLTGRVFFGEQLSRAQLLATLLAGAGVGFELWRAGSLSWEMWLVALGYTAYFVLRRHLRTDHLAGHWLDMALLVPAALFFTVRAPSSVPLLADHPVLFALLPLLGVLSAVALALYMAASGWLEVDKATLQHRRYPNVFGLGDINGTPRGKTAATVKKSAPIVAQHVVDLIAGRPLDGHFDGYTSCPMIVREGSAMLIEIDYDCKLTPSLPMIEPPQESYFAWLMKVWMLKPAYMAVLKGRV